MLSQYDSSLFILSPRYRAKYFHITLIIALIPKILVQARSCVLETIQWIFMLVSTALEASLDSTNTQRFGSKCMQEAGKTQVHVKSQRKQGLYDSFLLGKGVSRA